LRRVGLVDEAAEGLAADREDSPDRSPLMRACVAASMGRLWSGRTPVRRALKHTELADRLGDLW